MFKSFIRAALLAAFSAVVLHNGPARADILVGDFRGTGTFTVGPVLRFGNQQNGDVLPLSVLTTDQASERMQTPLALTYEPVEDVLYVSDYWGKAIRVYPANASGNAPALRVFNSPRLGQPRQLAIDAVHNEMIAIVSNCCIEVYPRSAAGSSVTPLRSLFWGGGTNGGTRLDNPNGIAWLPATDEIVVSDSARNPDNSFSGVLLFYPRTAAGDTAPTRSIEGPTTLLGGGIYGMAYDLRHDEIIALTAGAANVFRIITFPSSASGNAAPLRVIEGSSTRIENPGNIAYDADTEQIYVASGNFNSSNPAVLVFPRAASGDVAPVRVLAGIATGITSPSGIVGVPGDAVFASGFD